MMKSILMAIFDVVCWIVSTVLGFVLSIVMGTSLGILGAVGAMIGIVYVFPWFKHAL